MLFGLRFMGLGLVFLSSTLVYADNNNDPLSRILPPDTHVEKIASGTLDNTSDRYHFILTSDNTQSILAYLIREKRNGSTEIKEQVELGSEDARPQWQAKIQRKSLYISVDASSGCCAHSGETYQFMLNNKHQLMMVGYSELALGSADGTKFYEDKLNINLLTGEVIKSHAWSEHIKKKSENSHFAPSWRQFKLLPPVTKTVDKFHIAMKKIWTLQNASVFDDEFSNWLTKNIYEHKP